jgi:hypothetical protein
MNSENRANALAKAAAFYDITDKDSTIAGGAQVARYLENPGSIPAYLEVIEHVGERGLDGEVLVDDYRELRDAGDDPWEAVERAEAHYDYILAAMVAVVDLDNCKVLRRGGGWWTWSDLTLLEGQVPGRSEPPLGPRISPPPIPAPPL